MNTPNQTSPGTHPEVMIPGAAYPDPEQENSGVRKHRPESSGYSEVSSPPKPGCRRVVCLVVSNHGHVVAPTEHGMLPGSSSQGGVPLGPHQPATGALYISSLWWSHDCGCMYLGQSPTPPQLHGHARWWSPLPQAPCNKWRARQGFCCTGSFPGIAPKH